MLAFYFCWRVRRPRLALAALAIAVAGGLALGLGRVAQGAHFLSHVAWSGLAVWAVALVLYRVLLYAEDGAAAAVRHTPNRAPESPFELTEAKAKQ